MPDIISVSLTSSTMGHWRYLNLSDKNINYIPAYVINWLTECELDKYYMANGLVHGHRDESCALAVILHLDKGNLSTPKCLAQFYPFLGINTMKSS